MTKTNSEMPIFFAINDAYVPCLTVALHSLTEHAAPASQYKIIVLHQGLTPANQAELQALSTANVAVTLMAMDEQLEKQINDQSNSLRGDYFTYTIYFRLFIADMFPQYDKALYLDADIVVETDLGDLFAEDLGDNFFAGVADSYMNSDDVMGTYAEEAVGVPREDYINSGMLLLNLTALRREQFSQHFLSLLNQYHFASLAPDQDYINAMGHGRIHYLPTAWNVQVRNTGDAAATPHLVHYNLFRKPWHYSDAPHADFFWQEAQRLPIYPDFQKSLQAYTATDRQTDLDKLAHMQQLGRDICAKHPTFKEIQAQTGSVAL
ncbi:MAG: glycosyltransferase family 8 protein [Schleiferilactobacillus harbinensis]